MLDAAKLGLRILERGDRPLRARLEIADEVVRRIGRRFRARQQRLRVVVERRDHGLIGLVVASEETLGREGLEVQAIDEGAIAFGRGARDR